MAVDLVVTRFVQQGVSGLRSDLRAVGGDMATTERRIDRLSDRLLGFGATGAGALALIGGASLKAYGQIQMAEIAYTKSLGSLEAARAKIEELRQLDRESPFSFQGLIQGGARLKAVGFSAEELKDTLRDIGDATAGTMGTTEDFMGIGRALGQMRNKGRVSMEEINQLADRNIPALQILQKQLRLTDEELAKLMAGDLTISADKAIPALLKGFRELYGGAMLEASKTFPGQVSNLQSAVEQLGAAIGEVIAKGQGIGPTIESLTEFTDQTREFVKNNPELVKTGLTLAGVTVGATLLAGAGLKVYGIWRDVFGAASRGTRIIRGLGDAVKADTAAEATKALVAGREATALRKVGDAAKYSAVGAELLIAREAEAAMAAEDAAKAAGTQIKQLSLLARVRNFLNRPIAPAMSNLPSVRDADYLRHARAGYFTDIGLNKVSAFGRGGGALTYGGVAGGALMGGMAGLGINEDLRKAGYSAAQSAASGAFAGVGIAAASMFVPGGAVAAAVASGFRLLFNKLYNEPMEKRAGPGVVTEEDRERARKFANSRQAGDAYADAMKEAAMHEKRVNELQRDYDLNPFTTVTKEQIEDERAKAVLAHQTGMRARRMAMEREREERAVNRWSDPDFKMYKNPGANAIGRISSDKARRDVAPPPLPLVSDELLETGHQNLRNGSSVVRFQGTVHIPERQADRSERKRGYNLKTASPSFT